MLCYVLVHVLRKIWHPAWSENVNVDASTHEGNSTVFMFVQKICKHNLISFFS